MPAIHRDVLDSSIFLYRSADAAEKGERFGGSGFLVAVEYGAGTEKVSAGESVQTLYAVTNAHVVGEGFRVARLNRKDGGTEAVDLADAAWIRHQNGDDLAVAELGAKPKDLDFKAVPAHWFVEDPTTCAVGQEAIIVGRFVNHQGRQRNLPTVRYGNIAQLPLEPLYNRKTGCNQDSFLVDVRSLSGYSGSPVFVYNLRPDLDTSTAWPKSMEIRFLGVDWGHLPFHGQVVEEDKETPVQPKQYAEQNSGVAAVVPFWKLTELLFENEEVVELRKKSEKEWEKKHPPEEGVVADVADDRDEFERFEELVDNVAKVPKAELDKEREREKKRKS